MNRPVERQLFRPSQAPEVIGVSRGTIYKWAAQKKIKLHDLFGMTFVDMAEIREKMQPIKKKSADCSEDREA